GGEHWQPLARSDAVLDDREGHRRRCRACVARLPPGRQGGRTLRLRGRAVRLGVLLSPLVTADPLLGTAGRDPAPAGPTVQGRAAAGPAGGLGDRREGRLLLL